MRKGKKGGTEGWRKKGRKKGMVGGKDKKGDRGREGERECHYTLRMTLINHTESIKTKI